MESDRRLIREAIQGWERLLSTQSKVGISSVKNGNWMAQRPLCKHYLEKQCEGCPVKRATSQPRCHGTPFAKARDSVVDWGKGRIKKSRYLIEQQIKFLEGLYRIDELRRAADRRMSAGPVLSSELGELLGMSPVKLSHWMRMWGYHVRITRDPTQNYKKIIFYEKSKDLSTMRPGYRCEGCGRTHAVRREAMMPFSLTCADCGGQMHLVGVDPSVNVSHRIAGITLKELEQ